MPTIEVIRPLRLSPTGGTELTIVNRTTTNVYYGLTPTVNKVNKIGTLNLNESLTLTKGFVWVVAESTSEQLGGKRFQQPAILDLHEEEIESTLIKNGELEGPLTISPGALIVQSGASAEAVRAEGESTTHHAATAIQKAKTGTGAALNIVSENKEFSASEITGTESSHGTLKISHLNPGATAASDQNAAAISIDLQGLNGEAGEETGCQGIFMTSTTTEEHFSGSWFSVRNTAKAIINRMKSTGVWEYREAPGTPTGVEPECWALYAKEEKLFIKFGSAAAKEIQIP
ncbi:MAG TPA: hypothetical protein VMT20_06985 [Terriglobia bacterium]|nr:hypothetical protein [Terriglobia bacterium]